MSKREKIFLGVGAGIFAALVGVILFMSMKFNGERENYEIQLKEATRPLVISDTTATNMLVAKIDEMNAKLRQNELLLESNNRNLKRIQTSQEKFKLDYENIQFVSRDDINAVLSIILPELERRRKNNE